LFKLLTITHNSHVINHVNAKATITGSFSVSMSMSNMFNYKVQTIKFYQTLSGD